MLDTTTPAAGDNSVDTLSDVLRDARELARNSALGVAARGQLLVRVVEGAANGALSLDKPKTGKDDAGAIYDAYVDAEAKKSIHGEKTKTAKASALRGGIRMGMRNDIDPIEVINTAQVIIKELSGNEEVRTKSPFDALVAVTVAQNASKTQLTEGEIRECIVKDDPAAKTEEQYLKSALKSLQEAYALNRREEYAPALDTVNALFTFVTNDIERATKLAQIAALQAELNA